ncbi:MAG: hypothetical protein HY042_02355 [Spirochaetia bacterium]|nr:hypothetical protein [Spirochaetia bacterium]
MSKMGLFNVLMKYDKIRGESVAACMLKLRSQFGNAVIVLSTREVKEGGILGSALFSKRMVEIDFMLEEKSERSRKDAAHRLVELATQSPRDVRAPKFERLTKIRGAAKQDDSLMVDRESPVMEPGSTAPGPRNHSNPRKSSGNPSLEALLGGALESGLDAGLDAESEVSAEPIMGDQPTPGPSRPAGRNANFQKMRQKMVQAQLSPGFADSLLDRLDVSLSALEKAEYRTVELRALERLAEMIRTAPDIAPPGGQCRAVMLVGPTGSGKTTSLAKLAAKYHLYEGRDVSLYSLDHYRVAAAHQLETYAEVMGLPFHAPLSPDDFREELARDGSELMLIDTSGMGHKDLDRMLALKRFCDACDVKLEKHLVLAANTSAPMVEKIVLAFDTIGFDRIILTKLDETDFLGAFIELADKYNRPFSFLMNGQGVPEDVLGAAPMDLARMVLQEDGAGRER